MLAVAQTATQSVIEDAQTLTTKGGRMRIDTGFLRGSGQASLNGWPNGPSRQEDGIGRYDADLVIAGAHLGDIIHFGWTANYARHREELDGFMGIAVSRWQLYVRKAITEAKARFP